MIHVTEYTPTEPEIEKAVTFLRSLMDDPKAHRRELDPRAEGTTLAVVGALLGLAASDGADPAERVRGARAALVARERWAEQETKAA